MAAPMLRKVLVTGGTGLVGHGIQAAIAEDGAAEGEEWIFLSSRDCNLLDVDATRAFFTAAANCKSDKNRQFSQSRHAPAGDDLIYRYSSNHLCS